MSEEKPDQVLDFLRERFARVDAEIAALRQELGAAIEGLRQEIQGELGVLRAKQAEQEIFTRGMASFVTEVNAALSRIERKLDHINSC
jgi:hypothetical protein